jgi:hypothetical protein
MSFDRFAVGGDLALSVPVPGLGALYARGEIVVANNLDRALVPADPVVATRDLRETGYYAQLLQELGAHAQVGVRYDRYDPDADATARQSGNFVPTSQVFQTFAIAGALRTTNDRLILEYDVNRNHQGRDAAGNPVNLKDNALLLRAEVKF